MKRALELKNLLLLFLTMVILVGGLFFDAHETIDLSNNLSYGMTVAKDYPAVPLKTANFIKARGLFVASAAEVRDVRAVSEVIKTLEQCSSGKRIVILTLIICILISEGAFFTSILPSLFPWSDIICSRRMMVHYIHSQDGAK